MDKSIKVIFWLVGLFIIYLIIDFFFVFGANVNKFFDKWVEKTLWIWLPFYALPKLFKDIFGEKKK